MKFVVVIIYVSGTRITDPWWCGPLRADKVDVIESSLNRNMYLSAI